MTAGENSTPPLRAHAVNKPFGSLTNAVDASWQQAIATMVPHATTTYAAAKPATVYTSANLGLT